MTARDTSHVPRSRSAIIVLGVAQIAVASLVLLTGSSKHTSAPAMIAEFGALQLIPITITAQQVFARHALEEHARESGTALPIPMTARRDGATP